MTQQQVVLVVFALCFSLLSQQAAHAQSSPTLHAPAAPQSATPHLPSISTTEQAKQEPIAAAETGDAGPFHPVTFGQGVGFRSPDGNLTVNMRFRMQNRADFLLRDRDSDEGARYQNQWQVRRTRLRFQGHVVDPRLRYNLQLSFSRSDQDWDNSRLPNVVRDAMVLYDVTKNWQVAFGQGKLPGNRQRVVSSGNLQFVDRSLLNQRFNVDRDFGFQTQYQFKLGEQGFNLKGAVTSGEGRNRSVATENRSFYVARAEWLPFGAFERNGDYFEGDLAFEETPKLSIGYSRADLPGSPREGGPIGRILAPSAAPNRVVGRNQVVQFVDAVLKYRGYALSAEWAERTADRPIIQFSPEERRAILAGQGLNVQLSKLVTETLEFGARYTKIVPFRTVRSVLNEQTDMTLVASKYLNGHRTKIQGEIGYLKNEESYVRFQIELGI